MTTASETISAVVATIDALNWPAMSAGERALAESTLHDIVSALNPLDLPRLEMLANSTLVFRGDPRPPLDQQADKPGVHGPPPSVVDVRQQLIDALTSSKST